ncbi:MAG: hypothetical protein AB1585_00725 [Thermodesulfobacteriota bacterium]
MKHLFIILTFFLFFISTSSAQESGRPDQIQTDISQQDLVSRGGGIKTREERNWGLSMGIHSSFFKMQKNKGEIFRNINLLDEEQHYLPYKPSVQILISPYFALDFFYDHFKAAALNRAFDVYPEHDRRWTDGYLDWSPLMMSIQFRWPHFHPAVTPYVLGGMSYTKTSWERNDWYYYGFPSQEVYNQWTGQGLKPEDYPNNGYRRIFATEDHCLGVLVGLGLDYRIYKNWALNLDWRYHWAKVNFTYTLAYDDGQYVVGRDGGTFYLDSWMLSLSLKYFF